MPRTSKQNDGYSPIEAERRFKAALLGSRIAGHKSYEDSKVGFSVKKPQRKKKTLPARA